MNFEDGESASVGGGRVVYSNGSVYVGEMSGLQKNGFGILTLADGTRYEGWFKNDLYNTESEGNDIRGGTLTYPDKTTYTGGFKDGKYHGMGILTMSDGAEYRGTFENGEMSGRGKIVYRDKSSFEGTFKNGMRDIGIYTWKNGESISGIFKNNIPDPLERMQYTTATGEKYSVQIVNGIIVQKNAIKDTETDEK
jgi:hypothetical protein